VSRKRVPTEELTKLGHSKQSPIKAIREKCLDCCCGSSMEVKLCTVTRCALWPFRLGSNPWFNVSDIMREKGKALGAK
jgi:hypothetical protein